MSEARTFLIEQTVDLARVNPIHRYMQAMERGDAGAHEWRVTVTRGAKVMYLDGLKARCYITRAANAKEREEGLDTVTIVQDAQVSPAAGMVSCVLDAACYEGVGAVAGMMRLIGEDGAETTIAKMTAALESNAAGALRDPQGLIPTLEILLAQVERMETGTSAMEEAPEAAAEQAQAARTAAAAAKAAAAEIDGMTVSYHEAEELSAEITKKNGVKHIEFGLCRGAPGYGLRFMGIYKSLSGLMDAVPSPSQGDMYLVGKEAPYEIFMYNAYGSVGGWISLGEASGIGVVCVCGKYPDEQGHVSLSGSDISGVVTSVNGECGKIMILPGHRVFSGSVELTVAADASDSIGIMFERPFDGIPEVMITQSGTPVLASFAADAVTERGFTLMVENYSGAQTDIALRWMAIGYE